MSFLGSIRDTVKNAAETVGLEDELDKAEDTVQKATGKDLGGSGGGKDAEDVQNQGQEDKGNTGNESGAVEKAVKTAKDKASDVADQASDEIQDALNGASGGSGSSGGSGDENENVDEFQDGSGSSGGSSGSGNNNALKKFNEALEGPTQASSKDVQDSDIFSSEKDVVFESKAERNLQEASTVRNLNDPQDFNQFVRYKDFQEARQNKELIREQRKDLSNMIENLQGREGSGKIVFSTPSGKKSFQSESEAVDYLQKQRKNLGQLSNEISVNQVQRTGDIVRSQNIQDKQRDFVSPEEASALASSQDVNEFSVGWGGQSTGIKLTGNAADAAMVFDTFTSGGERSGKLVGAAVDQFLPGGSDRTVKDVAETSAIVQSQQLENGFNPVEEASETVTSLPGLAGAALAGGYAFTYGTSALAGSSVTGTSALASTAQAGGVALAGLESYRKTSEAQKELRKGNQAAAVGTGIELTAEVADFVAGGRAAAQKLSGSVGSTSTSQVNVLESTGDGFQGAGKMKGQTNVIKPEFQRGSADVNLRSPVTRDGLRSPVTVDLQRPGFKDTVKTVNVEARYGVDAGSGSAEAQGTVKVDRPDSEDAVFREFESYQNVRASAETRQGNKILATGDSVDSEVEGRLFRYSTESSSQGNTIIEGKTRGAENIDLSKYSGVKPTFDTNQQLTELSISTRGLDGSSGGTAENLVIGGRTDGGGVGGGASDRSYSGPGGSGSGKVGVSEGGSGSGIRSSYQGGKAYTVDAQSISTDQAQNYLDSQGSGAGAGATIGLSSQGMEGRQMQQQQQSQASKTQVVQNVPDGSYNVSTVSGGSQEMNSKAKSLNKEFSGGQDIGISSEGLDLVQGSEADTGQEVRLGAGLDTKNRVRPDVGRFDDVDVGFTGLNVQRLGLGLGQVQRNRPGVTQVSGLGQVQILRTVPGQVQRFPQTPITSMGVSTSQVPGTGAAFFTPDIGYGRGFSRGSQRSRGGASISGSSETLDILSANTVEQVTGEAAVFPLYGEGSGSDVSGLQPVQADKIDDREAFSGGEILI